MSEPEVERRKLTKPSQELLRRARLTDQERIDLFTILQQWSRNSELQAQKATDWLEARTAQFGEDIVRECGEIAASEFKNDFGAAGRVIATEILRKFGLKE